MISFIIAVIALGFSWNHVLSDNYQDTKYGYPFVSVVKTDFSPNGSDDQVEEKLQFVGTLFNLVIYFLASLLLILVCHFILQLLMKTISKKQLRRIFIFSLFSGLVFLIVSTMISAFLINSRESNFYCPPNAACSPPSPPVYGFPLPYFSEGIILSYPNIILNFVIYFIISFTVISAFYIVRNRKKDKKR